MKKQLLFFLLLIFANFTTGSYAMNQPSEELSTSLESLKVKLGSLAGSLDNITAEQEDTGDETTDEEGGEETTPDVSKTPAGRFGLTGAMFAEQAGKLTHIETDKEDEKDEEKLERLLKINENDRTPQQIVEIATLKRRIGIEYSDTESDELSPAEWESDSDDDTTTHGDTQPNPITTSTPAATTPPVVHRAGGPPPPPSNSPPPPLPGDSSQTSTVAGTTSLLADIQTGTRLRKAGERPLSQPVVQKDPEGVTEVLIAGLQGTKKFGIGLPHLTKDEKKTIQDEIPDDFVTNQFLQTKGRDGSLALEPPLFNLWLDNKLHSNIALEENEIEFYEETSKELVKALTPKSDSDGDESGDGWDDDDEWGEELSEDEIKEKTKALSEALKEYIHHFFQNFVGSLLEPESPYSAFIDIPANLQEIYQDNTKYDDVALKLEEIENAVLSAPNLVTASKAFTGKEYKEELFTDKDYLNDNLRTLTLGLLSTEFKKKLERSTISYLSKHILDINSSDLQTFIENCFDNKTLEFKGSKCADELENIRKSYFGDLKMAEIQQHKENLLEFIKENRSELKNTQKSHFYNVFEDTVNKKYAEYEKMINDELAQKDFIITTIEIEKLNNKFIDIIDHRSSNATAKLYRKLHDAEKIKAAFGSKDTSNDLERIISTLNEKQKLIQKHMSEKNEKFGNQLALVDHKNKLKHLIDEFEELINKDVKQFTTRNTDFFGNLGAITEIEKYFNAILNKSPGKIPQKHNAKRASEIYNILAHVRTKLNERKDLLIKDSQEEKELVGYLSNIDAIEENIKDQNNTFIALKQEIQTIQNLDELRTYKGDIKKMLDDLTKYLNKDVNDFLKTEYFFDQNWLERSKIKRTIRIKE